MRILTVISNYNEERAIRDTITDEQALRMADQLRGSSLVISPDQTLKREKLYNLYSQN